jgi:hypothetical protein
MELAVELHAAGQQLGAPIGDSPLEHLALDWDWIHGCQRALELPCPDASGVRFRRYSAAMVALSPG